MGILNHNLSGQHKRLLEVLVDIWVPLKHYTHTLEKRTEDAKDGLNFTSRAMWTSEKQRLASR
jgi:hypothetical protein